MEIIGAIIIFGVFFYCLWFFLRIVVAAGQDSWAGVKRLRDSRRARRLLRPLHEADRQGPPVDRGSLSP